MSNLEERVSTIIKTHHNMILNEKCINALVEELKTSCPHFNKLNENCNPVHISSAPHRESNKGCSKWASDTAAQWI